MSCYRAEIWLLWDAWWGNIEAHFPNFLLFFSTHLTTLSFLLSRNNMKESENRNFCCFSPPCRKSWRTLTWDHRVSEYFLKFFFFSLSNTFRTLQSNSSSSSKFKFFLPSSRFWDLVDLKRRIFSIFPLWSYAVRWEKNSSLIQWKIHLQKSLASRMTNWWVQRFPRNLELNENEDRSGMTSLRNFQSFREENFQPSPEIEG